MSSPLMGTNVQKVADRGVIYNGVCYRNVWVEFATQEEILSAKGSFIAGGRYNYFGTYEVLYLSCDEQTCHAEMIGSNRAVDPTIFPRLIFAANVQLSNVLDLTDERILDELGINQSILIMTNWRVSQKVGKEAPTQTIGRLVKEANFEAILVPSAARPDGKNLCVFTDNISPSVLQVINAEHLPSNRSETLPKLQGTLSPAPGSAEAVAMVV
jgi:RES domain-containing protein